MSKAPPRVAGILDFNTHLFPFFVAATIDTLTALRGSVAGGTLRTSLHPIRQGVQFASPSPDAIWQIFKPVPKPTFPPAISNKDTTRFYAALTFSIGRGQPPR
jgi:hypothetical protein